MKWLNLALVLALVFAGGLMLMLDASVVPAWVSLGGAALGFASAIGLCIMLNRKNRLPQ